MPSLAVISLAGGVGRTTLAATLARLAARAGHASLAVDWDPQNLLALHFGLQHPPAEGLASNAANGLPWQGSALRSADGAVVLPFGRLSLEQLRDWYPQMARERGWLADRLAQIELPRAHAGVAWTFIDTPRSPSLLTEQAMRAADAALLVLRADPGALALLPEALEMAATRPVLAVINGFDASRPLQQGVRAALRARLGGRLVPHVVHRDEAVPEAYAHLASLAEQAPHAQATHDLFGLMRWLEARLLPGLPQEAADGA
ncbi:MAG: cellulose synthase operon protein YhjQ [Leptothrix sp. (in: Bacteria)]|nr:cellulose synthase operon protein YhjQ [Leptothrix sp. (in: b-proteobacteria)]